MPWYALIGRDREASGALRQQHRPAHLNGLEALEREGRIRHAGPLLGEDGQPAGSLVVFEAASLDEARRIAAGDPYVVEGVFASWEVLETRVVFPKDV